MQRPHHQSFVCLWPAPAILSAASAPKRKFARISKRRRRELVRGVPRLCLGTHSTAVYRMASSVIRTCASVTCTPCASKSSRHSFASTPGVRTSRRSSIVLNAVQGAYFSGRLSPDCFAVKPNIRPGPLKMCICICRSGSCEVRHFNKPPFSS